jgi:hypothetical protein
VNLWQGHRIVLLTLANPRHVDLWVKVKDDARIEQLKSKSNDLKVELEKSCFQKRITPIALALADNLFRHFQSDVVGSSSI